MLKMHGTKARQKYNLISESDDKLLQYVAKGEWGGECRVQSKYSVLHLKFMNMCVQKDFIIIMWIHDVQWRDSVLYGETLHDKYYLFSVFVS